MTEPKPAFPLIEAIYRAAELARFISHDLRLMSSGAYNLGMDGLGKQLEELGDAVGELIKPIQDAHSVEQHQELERNRQNVGEILTTLVRRTEK